MKTIVKNLTLIGLMFFISAGLQAEELEKKISKEYEVSKGAMLKLANKYGKIHCENWDKNAISIEVEIIAEHNNAKKAENILENITVEISGSDMLVQAETKIGNMNCTNCSYDINYLVRMPKWINVDISMKYGSLVLDEVEGEAEVGIGYGDYFEINKITNDNSKVYLSYTENSVIREAGNTKFKIQYSDNVNIEMGRNLTVVTQYSELTIGKAEYLELKSNYDDVGIGRVNDLKADLNFADVEVEQLSGSMDCDLNYGDLEVNDIQAGFDKIKLYSNYADAELEFDPDAGYKLQAEIKYGEIEYPDNSKVSREEVSYTETHYRGVVGDDSNPSSSVSIRAKHADVELN